MISDSPPQEPPGELSQTPDDAREKKDKKSGWKMMVTPVALALLGLALLPVALSLYPSQAQTSAPAYSRLSVLTNLHITFITYAVYQVKPAMAEVVVGVVRSTSSAPLTTAPFANVVLGPPVGTHFRTCPVSSCTKIRGLVPAFTWKVPLVFNPSSGAAYASFYVQARNFGVSVNGIDAQAVLPEVFYDGTGSPEVLVAYHIPSAGSYDWSALPPAAFTGPSVGWTEPVVQADTPPKVAVGINQSRQSSDSHLAFIAGALIGVAGGAVVSAFQEALSRVFK